MKMKIVYPDGSWFIGDRNWKTQHDETKGTHHYTVLDGDSGFIKLKGKEIAVPVNQVKYFILHHKV